MEEAYTSGLHLPSPARSAVASRGGTSSFSGDDSSSVQASAATVRRAWTRGRCVGAGTAEVTVAVSLSTARSGGRRVDARTRRGAGDGGGGRGGAAPDGAELGTAAARTRRGGQAWAAAEDGPLRRGRTRRRIRREGERAREEGEGEMEVRGRRGRAEFEGFFEKKN